MSLWNVVRSILADLQLSERNAKRHDQNETNVLSEKEVKIATTIFVFVFWVVVI